MKNLTREQHSLMLELWSMVNRLDIECMKDDNFNDELSKMDIFKRSLDEIWTDILDRGL
jgi:hypothetical protein